MVAHSTPHMRTATAGLNLNDSVYERLLRERIVFLGSEVDDDVANRITAQQTGQSVDKVTADADRDAWFTAEEAREYGFIDHVVTRARQTANA